MPRVAVLHHLAERSCGHAAAALAAEGIELDERDLRAGDRLPAPGEADGLLSLGGEQSVLDGGLGPESAVLRDAVADGIPVLGVCLGAQLLAHALGGSVRRLERRMVSWPRVDVLPAAEGDPIF